MENLCRLCSNESYELQLCRDHLDDYRDMKEENDEMTVERYVSLVESGHDTDYF